jgi:hypothetical protein
VVRTADERISLPTRRPPLRIRHHDFQASQRSQSCHVGLLLRRHLSVNVEKTERRE